MASVLTPPMFCLVPLKEEWPEAAGFTPSINKCLQCLNFGAISQILSCSTIVNNFAFDCKTDSSKQNIIAGKTHPFPVSYPEVYNKAQKTKRDNG